MTDLERAVMTVPEFARRAGIDVGKAWRAIDRGDIPIVRWHSRVFIERHIGEQIIHSSPARQGATEGLTTTGPLPLRSARRAGTSGFSASKGSGVSTPPATINDRATGHASPAPVLPPEWGVVR